ncbi:MAG: hypothetical protein RL377_1308, partial [Bacteroidota bacterium]
MRHVYAYPGYLGVLDPLITVCKYNYLKKGANELPINILKRL